MYCQQLLENPCNPTINYTPLWTGCEHDGEYVGEYDGEYDGEYVGEYVGKHDACTLAWGVFWI